MFLFLDPGTQCLLEVLEALCLRHLGSPLQSEKLLEAAAAREGQDMDVSDVYLVRYLSMFGLITSIELFLPKVKVWLHSNFINAFYFMLRFLMPTSSSVRSSWHSRGSRRQGTSSHLPSKCLLITQPIN